MGYLTRLSVYLPDVPNRSPLQVGELRSPDEHRTCIFFCKTHGKTCCHARTCWSRCFCAGASVVSHPSHPPDKTALLESFAQPSLNPHRSWSPQAREKLALASSPNPHDPRTEATAKTSSSTQLGVGQNSSTRNWTAGFSLWFHLPGKPILGTDF